MTTYPTTPTRERLARELRDLARQCDDIVGAVASCNATLDNLARRAAESTLPASMLSEIRYQAEFVTGRKRELQATFDAAMARAAEIEEQIR